MRQRSLRKQRGADIVEFIITLPMMMIVFFVIVGFGVTMCDWAVIANASRAGAREAIRDATSSSCSGNSSCDCTSTPPADPIWCAAYNTWNGSLLSWAYGGTPPTVTVYKPNTSPGDDVRVTVSYTVRLGIPWLYTFPLQLRSVTKMSMLPY